MLFLAEICCQIHAKTAGLISTETLIFTPPRISDDLSANFHTDFTFFILPFPKTQSFLVTVVDSSTILK